MLAFLLRDKMNRTVSLISSFLASSPSLLWQHGTRQQGWYIGAILRKQFQNIQNLTVRFILSLTIYEVLSVVVEALLAWFVYESLRALFKIYKEAPFATRCVLRNLA